MQKPILAFFSIVALNVIPAGAAVFDDFNTGEGRFANSVTFSGSTAGFDATSTADQVGIDGLESPLEGAGQEKLVLDRSTAATSRLRFLSGGGTPANNVTITTSGAVDGWFGYYLKTSAPGTWTTQPWLEGASANGGIEKPVITDGQWHLYEWNLDDNSGGADGWGAVPGIVAGTAVVSDGAHTLDAVFLRGGNASSADNIFYLDFVGHNPSGSVAALVPEPSTYALAAMGGLGLLAAARRRK